MKYKKLLVLMTCLLFVTVAIFCFASAFKITDVELNYNVITGSNEKIDEKCSEYLESCKDKNLVLLNVDKVKEELSSLSGYVDVVSVDKVYPNKLSVTIFERPEAFSIAVGDGYYSLDSNLNVLAQKTDAKNNVFGYDNVVLELNPADFDVNLKVGKRLVMRDLETDSYLKLSSTLIYSMRDNLVKVSVTTKKDGVKYKTLTLHMREGVTFTILKANEMTLEKLQKTFDFYKDLSNKGYGEYITVLEDSGNITIKQ